MAKKNQTAATVEGDEAVVDRRRGGLEVQVENLKSQMSEADIATAEALVAAHNSNYNIIRLAFKLIDKPNRPFELNKTELKCYQTLVEVNGIDAAEAFKAATIAKKRAKKD